MNWTGIFHRFPIGTPSSPSSTTRSTFLSFQNPFELGRAKPSSAAGQLPHAPSNLVLAIALKREVWKTNRLAVWILMTSETREACWICGRFYQFTILLTFHVVLLSSIRFYKQKNENWIKFIFIALWKRAFWELLTIKWIFI